MIRKEEIKIDIISDSYFSFILIEMLVSIIISYYVAVCQNI